MESQARAAHRLDLLTSIALLTVTTALCLSYSRHRLLWSDEIFGWVLVTDPSLHHMLVAWRAGADGGGLFFYLFARAWLTLFGHTATAFRLFSATGVGIAAVLTFLTARRFARWPVAIASVTLLWFTSDTVLWQLMQARFYGLLLAGVAAAGYLFVRASELPRPTRTLLLLTFLCHTLLAGTHPFGIIYSAAILAVMFLVDLVRRRRPLLPLSALAGWWVILPSWHAIQSSAAVGKPHFWTTAPHHAQLISAYTGWSLPTAIVLGVCAASLLLQLFRRHLRPEQIKAAIVLEPAPFAFIAALLLVPLVIWIGSRHGPSFFVDRYLVPTVVAVALLLARLLTWLVPAPSPHGSRLPSLLFQAASFALAIWALQIALVAYPGYARNPALGRGRQIEQLLALTPRGLPIVVEQIDLFDQLVLYDRAPDLQYVSVLNWEQVTSPQALRGEVSGFHEMENWRNVGYFADSIQYLSEFNARQQPFLVIDADGPLWFEDRIRSNPAYQTRLVNTLQPSPGAAETLRIWAVCPNPSNSCLCAPQQLCPPIFLWNHPRGRSRPPPENLLPPPPGPPTLSSAR